MTCLHCRRRIWPNEVRPIPGGRASDYLCPDCERLRLTGRLIVSVGKCLTITKGESRIVLEV